MAIWQTPKTDWAQEDGVLNTDFNRIEENTKYLYDLATALNKTVLAANVTVYVNATTGNDTTGTGSSAAPFKTITKALSIIPKNLNGFTATVQLVIGTHAGPVTIKDFFGGTLSLLGSAGNNMTISGALTISNCSYVVINSMNLTLSGNGYLLAENGSTVLLGANLTVASSTYGIYAYNGSNIICANNTVTLSNITGAAVYSMRGSRVNLYSVSGSGNAVGLRAADGGVITFVSNSITGTAALNTLNGGRIYSNAQTSIPQY